MAEDDTDEDSPPGDGPRDCNNGVMNSKQNLSNGHRGSDTYQSNSNHASDIENTRQNKQIKEEIESRGNTPEKKVVKAMTSKSSDSVFGTSDRIADAVERIAVMQEQETD